MNALEQKRQIELALQAFGSRSLYDAGLNLLEVLGYRSDLVLRVSGLSAFRDVLDQQGRLPDQPARVAEWQAFEFLRQITGEDLVSRQQGLMFETQYQPHEMQSYLFLAIELCRDRYSRTELAQITRAVNRVFDMPALLIFKHGATLTFSIINRRLHKRDQSRDVLEKVTLIKDMVIAQPHRAHIEILHDLSFGQLQARHGCRTFAEIHAAWAKTLDIQELNKRFFVEIRNWFYWARLSARFPAGAQKDAEGRDSEALIRLLSRLIFCWFVVEKQLIPDVLFSERTIKTLLREWPAVDSEDEMQGRYYLAILQNLFFATLNTPVAERKFRTAHTFQGRNQHYGDQRYFRHVDLFQDTAPVEELYRRIPFLNGGLFEMLDEIPGRGDSSITQE